MSARAATLVPETAGFSQINHDVSERLQVITLDAATITSFKHGIRDMQVQALEYKPFLRFAIAEVLDKLCAYNLGVTLRDILHNRASGAFMLSYEGQPTDPKHAEQSGDFHVQLSTAISHLCGLSNFDSMAGKYYDRFTVNNVDSSDSYLRKAHRRMELHNDGTYVKERNDFVLMMKIAEENIQGGNSLILHLDDWKDLPKFYHHPLAKQDILWSSPPSKNIGYKIQHPVFFEEDKNGHPHILYIDQFAEPRNREEGLYLYEMGESLENEENCLSVPVPVGSMLVAQNHMWLHGRDKFIPHEGLRRELLCQRGHFTQ
jgi:protein CsiD